METKSKFKNKEMNSKVGNWVSSFFSQERGQMTDKNVKKSQFFSPENGSSKLARSS